jgi:PKD repeat protein
MTTYYVHKGVGSDSNNGLSWANAFSSLTKAKNTAGNNDTIYVRAGSTPYQEQLILNKNGQRWLADDGHQPIIDGKYHDQLTDFNLVNKPLGTYVVQKDSKGSQPSLTGIGGDDNEFAGFFIRNGAGNALSITGANNHVHHMKIDFHYGANILINPTGDPNDCHDNVVEDTETSRGSIMIFAPKDREEWGKKEDGSLAGYIQVCNAMKNCHHNTFRRIICHHQNGEALVLGKNSEYCVIELCTVWNNFHMNLYMNNTRSSIMRWNTSWVSWNDDFLRGDKPGKDPWPTECIVIGDEKEGGTYSRYNQVYGNLFVGGKAVIGQRNGSNYDTVLRDFYFGYNTCVGGAGVTKNISSFGPSELGDNHTNAIIENNILYHSGPFELSGRFFLSNTAPNVSGRGNLVFWEGHSDLNVPGFIGSAIKADPKLVNPKAPIVDYAGNGDNPKLGTTGKGPFEGNNFNANNYKLTGSSPAIGAAAGGYPFGGHPGVPLAAQRDILGATRSDPDIGCYEFGGQVTNSVTAAFNASPAATTLVEGTQVNFTDASFTTGSASITGRTWTVKKAGTTVHTATSQNLAYTFATDGSYTVQLAVTASGGLSDDHIVTYTITNDAPGVTVTAAFSAAPPQTTVEQGTVVTFTDQSTVQNGTLASRAWAVLELPGATVQVASGTGTTFTHTFNTPGSFRVRLTAVAATGQSDTETRDYTVNAVTAPTVNAAFTSSDGDGVINEGESITFTNTSTVANTTISGYLWTVTRSGGAPATYTSANVTHVFSQPGIYTVTLRADTAAGISDTETMTVTVLGQTTAGMDAMIVPHSFALATSTGTQTVTAAALGTKIPKGVHLKVVGATVAGTAAAGALLSEGAADGQAQWVHCRFSSDNEAVQTAAWRRFSTAKIAMTIDATGAKTGEAAFVKFVPGGMELNVTDAFPAGYLAEAVFYAGDAMEFWAGTIPSIGAAGHTRTVTTGIDQEAVYLCSTWAAVEDVAEAHADISRGWAVRNTTQYHIRNRDTSGAAEGTLISRLQPRIASSGDGTPGYCSIEAVAFTAAGSFGLLPYASAMNRPCSMFAFKAGGAAVWLGMVELAPATPLAVALPFEAQTVQAITSSYGQVTVDPAGQLGGTDAEGIGWATHSTHGPYAYSGSITGDQGAIPTDTHSLAGSGFRAVAAGGGDLFSGTPALDADSFDVTWTTGPTGRPRLILLAVEAGEEVVDPGDAPTADFTVTTEVDPAGGRLVATFDGSISNGNGETITAWAWEFGDGTTSTGPTTSHLYEGAGSYTVTLTVTTAAGTDSKSVTLVVPAAPPLQAPTLVGPIDPATSGGDTPNEIDEETASHTHEIAGKWMKFKPLTDEEFWDFQFSEPDPDHVLLAFWNDRFVVKRLDGVIRHLYPTTLPPPGSEGE